jgi:hypothetical protein
MPIPNQCCLDIKLSTSNKGNQANTLAIISTRMTGDGFNGTLISSFSEKNFRQETTDFLVVCTFDFNAF